MDYNVLTEELDEELALFVKKEIAPALLKSEKAEVLIENTDLGVG